MTYEQVIEAARKKPDAIWIDPGSVRQVAMGFQRLSREPVSLAWCERGVKEGLMKVLGIPVRVYELV